MSPESNLDLARREVTRREEYEALLDSQHSRRNSLRVALDATESPPSADTTKHRLEVWAKLIVAAAKAISDAGLKPLLDCYRSEKPWAMVAKVIYAAVERGETAVTTALGESVSDARTGNSLAQGFAEIAEALRMARLKNDEAERRERYPEHEVRAEGRNTRESPPDWSRALSGDEWGVVLDGVSRATAVKSLKAMGQHAKKEPHGHRRWMVDLAVYPQYRDAVNNVIKRRPTRSQRRRTKT
jgi:hypothetical protein